MPEVKSTRADDYDALPIVIAYTREIILLSGSVGTGQVLHLTFPYDGVLVAPRVQRPMHVAASSPADDIILEMWNLSGTQEYALSAAYTSELVQWTNLIVSAGWTMVLYYDGTPNVEIAFDTFYRYYEA